MAELVRRARLKIGWPSGRAGSSPAPGIHSTNFVPDLAGLLAGIWQAIKVDTASIVGFQIGPFGWMALSHFVIWQRPLPVDTSGHWFMMQIVMIVRFFTAWPVNRQLVRSAVKEKMDHRKHLAMPIEQMRREQTTEDARYEASAREGMALDR